MFEMSCSHMLSYGKARLTALEGRCLSESSGS